MTENFVAGPVILHGEGLAQLTETQLREELGALGLEVTVPALPQHTETLRGILEMQEGQPPVTFTEAEFRSFAAQGFLPAIIGKTWNMVCRLGICFPLTPGAVARARALETNVAFFYPSSLISPKSVPNYEQGFELRNGRSLFPEPWEASNPDAVSVQKLVVNGAFKRQFSIGDHCVGLLRQFCDNKLGVSH